MRNMLLIVSIVNRDEIKMKYLCFELKKLLNNLGDYRFTQRY
jgi:hypothetical protein